MVAENGDHGFRRPWSPFPAAIVADFGDYKRKLHYSITSICCGFVVYRRVGPTRRCACYGVGTCDQHKRVDALVFLPRDALVHSAILRLHVVCLSVRL